MWHEGKRIAYLEHVPLHPLGLLYVIQPPLRPEHVGILPKRILVPVQHPPVHGEADTAREAHPVQLRALGGHDPRDVQAHGGPHAHRLFEARLEVGQVLALVPRQVALHRDRAVLDGPGHLGIEFLVDALVREDVPEEGLHGGGGRVGAGEAAKGG